MCSAKCAALSHFIILSLDTASIHNLSCSLVACINGTLNNNLSIYSSCSSTKIHLFAACFSACVCVCMCVGRRTFWSPMMWFLWVYVCERSVKSGINEVSHTASRCCLLACLLAITTATWLGWYSHFCEFNSYIRFVISVYNVRCWEFKVCLLLVVAAASFSNMWPHALHCTFSPIRFRLWLRRSMFVLVYVCVYVVCLRLHLEQHDNADERIEILNHSNILVSTSPSVQSKQFVCGCHRVYFNIWQDTRTTRQRK